VCVSLSLSVSLFLSLPPSLSHSGSTGGIKRQERASDARERRPARGPVLACLPLSLSLSHTHTLTLSKVYESQIRARLGTAQEASTARREQVTLESADPLGDLFLPASLSLSLSHTHPHSLSLSLPVLVTCSLSRSTGGIKRQERASDARERRPARRPVLGDGRPLSVCLSPSLSHTHTPSHSLTLSLWLGRRRRQREMSKSSSRAPTRSGTCSR